ncbi:MAG: hypothetical protein IKO78_04995 [Bacilli bacterium]|nr:hypothetical protein [Bacilli bacterium]
MQKRSDRYTDVLENEEVKNSRVNKHHALYEEINSKIGYEEIPTYSSDEQINLSSIDMENLSRSEYQRVKDFKNLLHEPEDDTNVVQEEVKSKKKNYDINKVLEEAKKNRELDELEGKRKLKNEDYNVLNNLNKKYLHQKGFTEEDNEELKELIDTITSKTLVDDIKDEEEKELLSELLATTIDIKLESELSNEELQELTGTKENTGLVDTNSFYSKSLELSGSDLLDSEEVNQTTQEEESDDNVLDVEEDRNIFKIVFISIILLIVVLIVSYFVLQFLGISFN